MLRSKLFAGLVLVAGLVVTGWMPTRASAAPDRPVVIERYRHVHFVLYYRANPAFAWSRYGDFVYEANAERVASDLRARGLHTRIVTVWD